jgi:Spy/CpxP family protein refolding chaperone
MTRVVSLFLATFLLFSFAAYGFPGKDHGRHGEHDWWNNTEILEQLKLTDQQKSKIDEIASSNKEKLDNLRAQVKTDYEGFKEIMKNPNSTRDQILSKFDQLGKTHGELRRVEFEMALDMRDVLSPEQRTTLFDIKKQHREYHRSDK